MVHTFVNAETGLKHETVAKNTRPTSTAECKKSLETRDSCKKCQIPHVSEHRNGPETRDSRKKKTYFPHASARSKRACNTSLLQTLCSKFRESMHGDAGSQRFRRQRRVPNVFSRHIEHRFAFRIFLNAKNRLKHESVAKNINGSHFC